MVTREAIKYDVVIVGAGPAGLSAAIRLKQLDADLNVVVLEKGSEIGAHILSGAVLDTAGLQALIPDWKDMGAPIETAVKHDDFFILSAHNALRIPNFLMPFLMKNHGNFIVSMANMCRWLAEYAENLGVEIFQGMACSQPVFGADGELKGVVAGQFGVNKEGQHKPQYEPGLEIQAKYVLLAEGARGSLSKQMIAQYGLDAQCDVAKFGLGMKEIWQIPDENHNKGSIIHTMGWPLDAGAGGGSFLYHADNNQVFVGFVVHLNYKNPHLFPYMEFQRFKHHPKISHILKGGKRIAYGARVITEGGWQSLPKLVFPGGALLGCAAGMVNVARIKGNHNAMLSGKAAAEAVHAAIKAGRSGDELTEYEMEVRNGPIGKDLKMVRNIKPIWSRWGMFASLLLGGFDMWIANLSGWNPFGNLKHGKTDAKSTGKAADYQPIDYPNPDGILSFDRLTNVSFSDTNHVDDQPVHLQLTDPNLPLTQNLLTYDEPAQRYCPAGVYEITKQGVHSTPYFHINAQNCLHCKACDIKDPLGNITWATPEGGGGPNYSNM